MNTILTRLIDDNELEGVAFPGGKYFPSAPEDEQRVRRWLGCDGTYGFYTPVILCRAIQAYSWLWALVGEDNSHYGKFLNQYPLFNLTNSAQLVMEDTDGPIGGVYLKDAPFPIPRYIDVTVSGQTAQLVTSYNLKSTQTVSAVETDTDGTYEVDWPEWTGIQGWLSLPEGLSTRIYVRPLSINWNQATATLNDNASGLSTILQRHGLSGGYFNSDDPMERVATAATAVVLNNDDIGF